MVDRDIKKSLDLLRVQIHRQHPRHASSFEQIRYQPGSDWHATLFFPILPRIGVIGDYRHYISG